MKTAISIRCASLGLYRVAESRGKDAHIVLNKLNPTIGKLVERIRKDEEYEGLFITGYEAMDLLGRRTLLVVVDTHRKSFAEMPELIDNSEQVVVIDHHRRGADYIQDTVLTYQNRTLRLHASLSPKLSST